MLRRSALGALLTLVVACGTPGTASVAPITPVPPPLREPASLAVLPEERAVLDAFRSGGLTVGTVGGSKDERALGPPLPARAFIAAPGPTTGGFGEGANVLFLPPRFGVIEVCARPGNTSGRTIYTLVLDGRKVSDADAAAPIYYLVGPEHLVIAYDTRTRDALEKGLGLKRASAPSLCS